jgi:hypothetical protein
MIETVITALIYLCILAITVYVVLWVLEQIGVHLPSKVINLLWIIVALVVLLFIIRAILPNLRMNLGTYESDRITLVKSPY